MLTAKKLMVLSGEEVRSKAVQTLIKRMGITKAAYFHQGKHGAENGLPESKR